MKHAYIAPIEYLDYVPINDDFHLTLAHLFVDKRYTDFYSERKKRGDFIICDNGAFEKKVYTKEQLGELLSKLPFTPDVVVAPDYPFQEWRKTLDSTIEFVEYVEKNKLNVSVMGVPQSTNADYYGWVQCYKEMVKIPQISFIGLSILGIPNAFRLLSHSNDVSFNRMICIQYLMSNGIWSNKVKHHCLGLGSNIKELVFMKTTKAIYSNDSSSAIWHGINGIKYDHDCETLLVNGKIEKEVDFFIKRENNNDDIIKRNIDSIRYLIV